MGKAGAGQNAVKTPSETPSADAIEALQELLDSLGDGTGLEACVYEIAENGSKELLRTYAVKEFDPFTFAAEYGGGRYFMRVRDVGSKAYRGQKSFTVSARVKPAAAKPPPAAPVSDGRDRAFEAMLAMMTAQSAQTGQVLAAMIARPQVNPLADIMPLLVARETPKPAAQNLGELIDGLAALDAMRGEGGVPEGGWTTAIPSIVNGLKALSDDDGDDTPKRRAAAPPRKRVRLVPVKIISPGGSQGAATEGPSSVPSPAAEGDPADAGAGPERPPAEVIPPADSPGTQGEEIEVADVEDTIRTLGTIIVGEFALTDGNADVAELIARVVATMDTNSLEHALEQTPEGKLAKAIAELMPAEVAAKLMAFEPAMAVVERRLRRELAEGADAGDEPHQADAGESSGGGAA